MRYKTPTGYIERPKSIVWENPLVLIIGTTIIGEGLFNGEKIDFEVFSDQYFKAKSINRKSLNIPDTIEPELYGFVSKRDKNGNPTEFKIKCLYAGKSQSSE